MSAELELKFVLDLARAREFLDAVARHLQADPHTGPDTSYPVWTEYCDGERLPCYQAAVDGLAPRTKVRLRRYDYASPTVIVELKLRDGRRRVKLRESVPAGDAGRWLRDPPETGPLASVAGVLRRDRFVPRVTVYYRRFAFGSRAQPEVRVTLDDELRCGGPDLFSRPPDQSDLRLMAPGRCVLELKLPGRWPAWLARAARDHELVESGCCKYRLAVEALHARRRIAHG